MLKKLVALTLAALMLINPMTAFAVSWGSVVDTLYTYRYYNENGVDATVDDNGNVTVSAGTITDFYTDSRFKSYTFKGSVVIDGQEFEVHVGEADAVLVNIESGVGVQVGKMSISTNSGSIEFNNSAEIKTGEMFVDAGTDGDVVVMNTSSGIIVVEDELGLMAGYEEDDEEAEGPGKATLEFINAGSVTTENLWAWSHEGGSITIDNDGGTISMEVGEHENPSEDEQPGPGEINMMADGSGNLTMENDGTINGDVDVNMGWEDDSPEATGTGMVVNGGTINGDTHAWIHDDSNASITNSGEVNGAVESFANDTADTSMTNTIEGTVTGGIALGAYDGSAKLENAGSVTGGDVRVSAEGSAEATLKNTGDITTDGHVGIDVGGTGTGSFTNTGDIDAERFDAHAYGEGTMSGSNSGSIDVEWGYVGSSDNGNSSFTNESEGYIHTDENFDIVAGNWNGEEDYEYDPSESSNTSFVNSGDVVTEGGFAGNLQENGSVTLENTETGTMTAVNHGIHISINDNGNGSVSVNNAGTVNSEWFNVGSQTTGTASITNTGTVNGYMGAYADGVYDDEGNLIETNKDGKVNITNSDTGIVNGGMGSYVNGGGTGTVVNNGTAIDVNADAEGEGASVNLTNDGTAEFVHVGAYEGATGTAVNTGIVTGELQNTAGNGGSSSAINNGTTNGMWSHADEGGSVSSINNSSASNQGGYSESDDSSVAIMNNGTVEGWLEGYMFGNGSAEVVNNGYVGIKVSGVAGGEGSVTAVNTSKGTIGDGVRNEDNPPDGLWVSAENGGTAAAINDGTINGEIGGGAYGEGSVADVVNTENGTADTSWVDAHGGELALNNEGEVKGTLSVSIGTQSNEVTSTDTVAQLLEQTGVDISGYSNVDIYTANQDGELIARYSVAADGTVVLEEVLMEQGGGGFDDPRFWTEERIRHDKEEERKAAAIGGVFGSPYWLKQLYLGYMSLNLRLFSGEDQLLFKESLSWVPDTGKLGEKVLTLKVKTEDTSALTMRLDGSVIEKLEQAGIVSINIVDGAGNLFMEYKVQDLKDARAMYGLTEAEYIVVGAADADVLKIAEDGTVSPIEGEAAEEVADEANKEATEEPAEETPAA